MVSSTTVGENPKVNLTFPPVSNQQVIIHYKFAVYGKTSDEKIRVRLYFSENNFEETVYDSKIFRVVPSGRNIILITPHNVILTMLERSHVQKVEGSNLEDYHHLAVSFFKKRSST